MAFPEPGWQTALVVESVIDRTPALPGYAFGVGLGGGGVARISRPVV